MAAAFKPGLFLPRAFGALTHLRFSPQFRRDAPTLACAAMSAGHAVRLRRPQPRARVFASKQRSLILLKLAGCSLIEGGLGVESLLGASFDAGRFHRCVCGVRRLEWDIADAIRGELAARGGSAGRISGDHRRARGSCGNRSHKRADDRECAGFRSESRYVAFRSVGQRRWDHGQA